MLSEQVQQFLPLYVLFLMLILLRVQRRLLWTVIHSFSCPLFSSAVASAILLSATNSIPTCNLLFLICHRRNQMAGVVRMLYKWRARLWEIARDPILQQCLLQVSWQLFPFFSGCTLSNPLVWQSQQADLHLQEVFLSWDNSREPSRMEGGDTHTSVSANTFLGNHQTHKTSVFFFFNIKYKGCNYTHPV